MGKYTLVMARHAGGWSTDLKEGQKNSFYYSRHLDFRKQPSLLTILPKTVKETSTTVTALITSMLQLPSGKIIGIDTAGGVYTRATNSTWSKDATSLGSSGMGMVYNFQHDRIYVPGTTTLHSIDNADARFGGTFTPNDNIFTANVDQSLTGGANTYTSQSSIVETATHRQSFVPTVDPLYSIKIKVVAKGDTNLVVTVHDAANNSLGTKTLTAAELTNGALNEFVFSTPIRMLAKPNAATYHFHVTHSAGTASTVQSGTASDLETADFETYGDRLLTTLNGLHPVIEFLQYICIGNGRYLTVWEPISQSDPSNTEWDRHRLTFPPGYEVTSLGLYNEFLAIACEKRSSSSTNEFQDGKIFLWDGTSNTYNFPISVPEGSPYSLFSHKNTLYWFAGGRWWAWAGGQPVPLFQMPNTDFEFTDRETYMVNYPQMMTVRNNILVGGFPSETNSQAIEHGVYSFGSRNKNYPDSFGLSYSMSTGSRVYDGSNALRLGVVTSLGDKLFISWRDDSQSAGLKFGVDVVDPDSDPFGTATWESLLFDHGRPFKEKKATEMTITFKALPAGATVTPKYKIDREASWNLGTAATEGATMIKLNIHKQFREIQMGFDLVATATTPEITAVELVFDDQRSEAT